MAGRLRRTGATSTGERLGVSPLRFRQATVRRQASTSPRVQKGPRRAVGEIQAGCPVAKRISNAERVSIGDQQETNFAPRD